LEDSRTPSETLDILGRCRREDACESAPASRPGLAARLHWMNGPVVNRKIAAPGGRLHRMLSGGSTVDAIVTEFYLPALARPPTGEERAFWSRKAKEASGAAERVEILEDFVWGLLSGREFQTNH